VTDQELEWALRAYTRRRPFRPFLIEFVSGSQVRMEHPDAIAFVKPLWLYRGPKRAQTLFASSAVCRLLDVPPGTRK
jgi:hypothetical protein